MLRYTFRMCCFSLEINSYIFISKFYPFFQSTKQCLSFQWTLHWWQQMLFILWAAMIISISIINLISLIPVLQVFINLSYINQWRCRNCILHILECHIFISYALVYGAKSKLVKFVSHDQLNKPWKHYLRKHLELLYTSKGTIGLCFILFKRYTPTMFKSCDQ